MDITHSGILQLDFFQIISKLYRLGLLSKRHHVTPQDTRRKSTEIKSDAQLLIIIITIR